MGCAASTAVVPPQRDNLEQPLNAEVSNGSADRATVADCVQGFVDVFTKIATPGYFAAVVAQNGGLAVSVWNEHRELFSGFFSKAALLLKKAECQCTWDGLFSWLHHTCVRASTFDSGVLKLRHPGNKSLPMLQASLDFEVEQTNPSAHILKSVLHPIIQSFLRLKKGPTEEQYTALELEQYNLRSICVDIERSMQTMRNELQPMQDEMGRAQDAVRAAKDQVEGVVKWVARLKFITESYDTDILYPRRPPSFLLHVKQAKQHIPLPVPYNPHALHQMQMKYRITTQTPEDLPEDLLHETILQQLGKVDSWDYDVFGLQHSTRGCPLFFTAYELLHRYDLVTQFHLNETTLFNFLQAVEAGYHPNHYHNNVHAADVLQCLHYILTYGGLKAAIGLQPSDLLAALLSAAIHDYDHPGFNNNFHVKTQAYLAILYNDRSVLENHHLASVFELLKDPKYNVFESLNWDQYKDVRDSMTEMVLSTDMGLHSKITQKFKNRLAEDKPWDNKADQRLALSIALKVADISNCCRSPQFYNRWARCIVKEFYLQGDAERTLGFSVSPYMDRTNDESEFVQGQVSFMNYIVIPLTEAVCDLLPQMKFAVDKCQQNRDMLSSGT